MKYKCLQCNSVFVAWGKKPAKYGGHIDCCPNCGNNEMTSIQRNFGFGWTNMTKKSIKQSVGILGIIVIIIGFILYSFYAYTPPGMAGMGLISLGLFISIFALLTKTNA